MTTASTVSVASIHDIPGAVKLFADSLGFTTAEVSATEIYVQHPAYTPARTFTVSSFSTGAAATLRERIIVATDAVGGTPAWAESPKLNPTQTNSAASVIVSPPTQLFLFGQLEGDADDSGESYIAGVIAYGFNRYRHFYLGYVAKSTAFEGGEITTGSAFAPTGQSSSWQARFDSTQSCYPFQGTCTTDFNNGGVYVDHANAVTKWRQFSMFKTAASNGRWPVDNSDAATFNQMVAGGFPDGINEGYLSAAFQPFSNAAVLVPINLYIGMAVPSPLAKSLAAIGHVPGVRMVDIQDMDPEDTLTLGSETWRVFPGFQKNSESAVTMVSGLGSNAFMPAETSRYVGLAYKVSD